MKITVKTPTSHTACSPERLEETSHPRCSSAHPCHGNAALNWALLVGAGCEGGE